jgi:hypothetical protein
MKSKLINAMKANAATKKICHRSRKRFEILENTNENIEIIFYKNRIYHSYEVWIWFITIKIKFNRFDDQIMINARLNAKFISIHHFWNIFNNKKNLNFNKKCSYKLIKFDKQWKKKKNRTKKTKKEENNNFI